jgi:hypothetical protein
MGSGYLVGFRILTSLRYVDVRSVMSWDSEARLERREEDDSEMCTRRLSRTHIRDRGWWGRIHAAKLWRMNEVSWDEWHSMR